MRIKIKKRKQENRPVAVFCLTSNVKRSLVFFAFVLFFFTILFYFQSLVKASTSTDGLVGYWKMDETVAGSTIVDYSDEGNNGTPIGGIAPVDADSGFAFSNPKALDSDGVSDSVSLGNPTVLQNLSQFTYALWIKPDASQANADPSLIDKGNNSATRNRFRFLNTANALNYVRAFTGDDGSWSSPDSSITVDVWQHVAITYNRGSTSNVPAMYVNGVSQTVTTVGTPTGSVNDDSGTNINIGALGSSTTTLEYAGLIDDVRIYNRILSSTEITALAAKTHTSATWDGSSSTNWETAANWDINAVPDNYTNITIADVANDPVLTASIETANLTINTTAILSLDSFNLTFNDSGTFTNNGTLKLRGSETLTSFTNDTDTGTVTFVGDDDNSADTFTITSASANYFNLTIDGDEDGANVDTFKLGAALDINGNLTLTDGTFDVDSTGNNAITLAGNWSNTSATFNEQSGNVTFNGSAAQTLTGETFYNLTINNSGTPSDSLDVESSAAVTVTNNLAIDDGQFSYFTASDVDGNVTIASGAILKPVAASGTLTVFGSWTNSGTFTHNSGTVTFNGTATGKTINPGSSNFSTLTINGSGGGWTLDTNDLTATTLNVTAGTLDVSANTKKVTVSGTLTVNGGTLTATNGDIDANGDVTVSSGTLTAPTAADDTSFTVVGNWTVSSTGTFTPGTGRVIFDATGSGPLKNITTTSSNSDDFNDFKITGSGTASRYDVSDDLTATETVTLSGGTLTLFSGIKLTAGVLTVSGGTLSSSSGDIDVNGNFTLSSGTLTAPSAQDDTSFTVAGNWEISGTGIFDNLSGRVVLDATSGTPTIITSSSNGDDFYQLKINGTGITFTLEDELVISDDLIITAGTLDTKSGENNSINIAGDWSNSGAFTEQQGTVTFNGAAAQTLTGETFYNLTINNSAASPSDTIDVDSSAAVTVSNTLTVTDGQFQPTTASSFKDVSIGATGVLKPDSSASVTVSGNWSKTVGGTFTANSGTVAFNGSAAQTLTGETFYNLTINNSGTPSDSLDVESSAAVTVTNNLAIDDGQFSYFTASDVDGNVTIASIGTLKPAASGGTLTVAGNWTKTAGGTFTANSGTVTFNGSAAQTLTGETFYDLIIANTHASDDVESSVLVTVTNNLAVNDGIFSYFTASDIDGNVTIASGATLTPAVSGGTLTVGGSWTNSGTFTANSGTVIFDGTGKSLTGSTTFYNLTKSVTSADTLTFPASATQTIASGGTLTLSGASGQLLSLRSSSTPTKWGLTLNGTAAVSYVDVKDSDASGGTAITQTNSTDSGNNLNWSFDSTPPAPSSFSPASGSTITDSTPTITFSLDENGDCRAGTLDDSYDLMSDDTDCTGDGTTSISCTLSDLGADGAKNVYVACQDTAYSNKDTADTNENLSYTLNTNTPVISNISPASGSTIQSSVPDITFTTSESADCRASTTDESYDGMSDDIDCAGDSTTSISCSTSSINDDGSVNIYIACQDTDGNKDTAGTNTEISYSITTSSGGGGIILEKIAQIPEKIIEQVKEIPRRITQLKDQLVKLLQPEKEELPAVVEVPEEAPLVLQGKWNIFPAEPIYKFVLAPLPTAVRILAQKFPEFEKTLSEVGVSKITDVEKLKTSEFVLPNLAEVSGLPKTGVEPGKFALPYSIPIAKLTSQAKELVPSEIVFARTGGELIDYNTFLTITDKNEPQQKISTIVGKPLRLVMKPDGSVKSIKGYIVFKSKKPRESSLQIPLSSLTASLVFSGPNLAQKQQGPIDVEEKLVLLEFEYTDPDGDGIYTADVNSPLVDGEYEIITVIDYEDLELGTKAIRLITVVDPEGYLFEKDGDKETRIPGAVVSIYWLNPQTKQYELWPAKDFQQDNPQITDVRGTYSFLVPNGYYYLKVDAPGYDSYDGKPFEVTEGSGIHFNIELKTKYWWLRVFDWKTILLVVVVLLLLYNFYKDKIREKRNGFK